MSESTAHTSSGRLSSGGEGTHADTTRGYRRGASQLHRSHLSNYTKLGLFAICVLSISLSLIIGSVAFLWFLWLADGNNHTWRQIADRNWVTRAVSLSSLAIRQSISFQASAATAMSASLALEHGIILLLNLASVSLTRNSNGGPYMLFWWLWRAFYFNRNRWQTFFWPLVVALLASTTILTQFTSFVLLSDLDLVIVQAQSTTKKISTHFEYSPNGTIPVVTHGSTWSQQLRSYVSFAEHHEEPNYNVSDGVIDTGPTLRAFLPVLDQQSRSMVSEWDGLAMVLDARTVCMRPRLLQPYIHYADTSLALETGFAFDLDLSKVGLLDVNVNDTCVDESCPGQTTCMIPLRPLADVPVAITQTNTSTSPQWRLVICQPAGDEGQTFYTLQSELRTPGEDTRKSNHDGHDPNYSFGNAYVVVNVSSGSEADWASKIPGEDPNLGIFRGKGTLPSAYGVHGQNNEWYDLFFSEDGHLNLSVSVCYTAFDTADLHVNIDSPKNHSDVQPTWNADSSFFDYHAIRAQYGQELDGNITYSTDYEKRNIMRLQKRGSWVPEPDYGDYVVPSNRVTLTSWITDYANMAGSLQGNAFDYLVGPNQAQFMWQAYQINGLWSGEAQYGYADPSLMGLVQEILQTGGSLSFAMQSIVTSLTQLAYYQQLQQLNAISDVTSSSYIVATAPVQKRGILAVTIVLCVHILVVFCIILPAFLLQTRISTIGNSWHAVAQILGPKVEPILESARLATDSEAEKTVKIPTGKKRKLKNKEIVGIYSPDGRTVCTVSGPIKSGAERTAKGSIKATGSHRSEPVEDVGTARGDQMEMQEQESEAPLL